MATKNGNKTTETSASVADFLNGIDKEQQRADAWVLHDMMQEVSGLEAKMWGANIVGFGSYHYKYESGREGDMLRIGFSPRSGKMSIYIIAGFDRFEALLANLGKHKHGKSCLYVTKLSNVDMGVLRQMVQECWDYMAAKYAA